MNLKDKLTTYAAIAFSTAMVIITLPTSVSAIVPSIVFTLPPIVNVVCGIVIIVSIAITQILNGKNPDGSTKTPEQVIRQNKEAKLS